MSEGRTAERTRTTRSTETWKTHAPTHPVLGVRSFFGRPGGRLPSVTEAGSSVPLISGRMALANALLDAAVGAGSEFLLPAYHCEAIVEPVLWVGATPCFYRVHADTAVDLDHIEKLITPRTRGLLVVHYFGFLQDMPPIRALCDRHGLLLVEDCAHAFFGIRDGVPVGTTGDYALASAWKFFPLRDGGLLLSCRRPLRREHYVGAGAIYGFKSLINNLEAAWTHGRLLVFKWLFLLPLWAANRVRNRARAVTGGATRQVPLGSSEFQEHWVNKTMPAPSRVLLGMFARSRVVRLRRRNFSTLLEAFAGLPGARPLFRSLPAGVAPYVFPLVVDEPATAYRVLKDRGVPMVRFGEELWPGMDLSVCPVTSEYAEKVIQFPCHQELRTAEIRWITKTVGEVLNTLSRTNQSRS